MSFGSFNEDRNQNSISSLDFFGLTNVSVHNTMRGDATPPAYLRQNSSIGMSAYANNSCDPCYASSPTEKEKLRPWFVPSSSLYDPALLLAAIIYVFSAPIMAVFSDSVGWWYAPFYAMDLVALCSHCSRYYDKMVFIDIFRSKEDSSSRLATRRMLISNIVTVLPWDLCFIYFGYPTVPLLRLIRLYQMDLLMKFMTSQERRVDYNFLHIRSMKLVVFILVLNNLVGCTFFGVSRLSSLFYSHSIWTDFINDHMSYWDIFVRAMQYAGQTITTTGYGDIPPQNTAEVFTCWALVLVSSLLWVYVLANATSLVMRSDSQLQGARNKQHLIEKYLQRRQVSDDVAGRVRNFFRDKIENKEINDEEALDLLPYALKKDVMRMANLNILNNCRYDGPLYGCTPAFISSIAAACRRVVYLPGDVIIHQEDHCRELHILERGRVEYGKLMTAADRLNQVFEEDAEMFQMHDQDNAVDMEKVGCKSSAGSFIGEYSFIFGIKQPFEIQCTSKVVALVITLAEFEKVCKRYPSQFEIVKRNLLHAVEDSNPALFSDIKRTQMTNRIDNVNKLFYVVSNNDVAEVLALSRILDIHDCDFDRRTALHVAAAKGYVDMIETLIRLGLDVNKLDISGKTPMMDAVERNHVGAIDCLISHGGVLTMSNNDYADLVNKYAHCGNLTQLRALLRAAPDRVNIGNSDKRTGLHIAASDGLFEAMLILINAGACVNAMDRYHKTPLQDAVLNGHERIVDHLLSCHAKLHMEERLVAYYLCQAIERGKLEELRLLLKASDFPNARTSDKRTPLHCAVLADNISAVKLLLTSGAKVCLKDNHGISPLEEAALQKNSKILNLIKYGEVCRLLLHSYNFNLKLLAFGTLRRRGLELQRPSLLRLSTA